jgi:hypothetical protein
MLYGSYGAPGSSEYATYASIFHDVTTGGGFFFSAGASAGYDLVTGLGSPNVPQVVNLLTNTPITVTATTTPKVTVAKPRTPIDRFVSVPLQQNEPIPSAIVPASNNAVAPAGLDGRSDVAQSSTVFSTQAIIGSGGARVSLAAGSPGAEISGVLQGQLPTATGTTISSAVQNIAAGASGVANLTEAQVARAAAGVKAVAQSVASPHVALELARLDASVFADSLAAFARESASVAGATVSSPWAAAAGTIIAAVLSDAVLVGYWYQNRSRRKSRSPVLAAPEVE